MERYIQKYPDEDYELWHRNFFKKTIPDIARKNIHYIVLSEMDYDQEGIDWLQQNAVLIKAFVKYGNTWRIRIYKVLPFAKNK